MNVPLPPKGEGSSAGLGGVAGDSGQRKSGRAALDPHSLVSGVGALLARRGENLAICETSAGGALATLISAAPACEKWFRGGLILYGGNESPLAQRLRHVSERSGVVSEEYAAALAQFARRTFACEWAIAESGIAGPQTGRRSAKPVGMVCLAVAGPGVEAASGQARDTSPGIAEGPDDEGSLKCGPERDQRDSADAFAGQQQVRSITRILQDAGRTENQQQFAVESLRLLQCLLEA